MYFKEVREQHPDWKAVWGFSIMNPFIDFVVFVPVEQIDDCVQACRKGMDEFWEDVCDGYGDLVEYWLHETNVSYEIFYAELLLDESDVTLNWEEAIKNLDKSGVIVAYV